MAHQVVVTSGTLEALQGMLDRIEDNDRRERELVVRAINALAPDGWRGLNNA